MKRLEIYLTYRCNRKCIYCFSTDSKKRSDTLEIDFKTVSSNLYISKKNGVQFLTLLGGEPTIHKDFIRIISLAKKLGYYINIFTNGLKFSDIDFLNQARDKIDYISINIPDHRKEEYEFLTGLKGSYKNMLKAIENISKYKIPSSLIFLINKINYKQINEYVDFYSSLGIKLIIVQYLKYMGRAEESRNQDIIKIRLSDTINYVKDASDRMLEKNCYPFFYEHLPLCFMKEYSSRIFDIYIDETESSELIHPQTEVEDVYNISYKDWIKPAACKKCIYCQFCPGIDSRYTEIFGSSEVKAIKNKVLPFWNKYTDTEKIRKSKLSLYETIKEMSKHTIHH